MWRTREEWDGERTFLLGFVCQHRPKGHIADAFDAADVRVELIVDYDSALVILLHTDRLEVESFGVRSTTNGDKHHVSLELSSRGYKGG
jgi:hypothetical protein